jgi:hypothetical protein
LIPTVPLARPPGRRGLLRRLAPEFCAAGVYAVWFLAGILWLWAQSDAYSFPDLEEVDNSIQFGAACGYGLAGLLLLVFPVTVAAMSLASEKSRGTAEAMVLTPVGRAALAWGRYWHLLWPWLRLMVYVSPLVIWLACGEVVDDIRTEGWPETLELGIGWGCCPRWFLTIGMAGTSEYDGDFEPCWLGPPLAILRLINDGSLLVFVTGVAYLFSASSRSSGRALALSWIAVPLALCTVVALDCCFMVVLLVLAEFLDVSWARSLDAEVIFGAYAALALLMTAARYALGLLAVALVARNFDRWMLGERGPP